MCLVADRLIHTPVIGVKICVKFTNFTCLFCDQILLIYDYAVSLTDQGCLWISVYVMLLIGLSRTILGRSQILRILELT